MAGHTACSRGGAPPPRAPHKASPARPPACFVAIGFSAQSDAEPSGRGLAGRKMSGRSSARA
eukprot:4147007-Alexandrium_andersonii.AAC.1